MITEKEKEIILQCAKKYKVSTVILFGSSIRKGKEANDIDIGVKGNELIGDYFADILVENEIIKNYHGLAQTNTDDNEP